MKAIIVDFDGDYIIVANSRGDFKRIYNNYQGCQIGDEITISMLSSKKILALAACFLIMLVTSYGIYGYVSPVTYVTVDINPSVEFSLNRYDVVRDVRGLNEEGKIIVADGSEYKNMKFERALNLLLSKAVEADYLNKDTNTIMLTMSSVKDSISPDKTQQLEEMTKTQLKNIIEKDDPDTSSDEKPEALAESQNTQDSSKSDFNIIVEKTTYKKHQESREKAVSQGKLVLYEKLKKVKPDVALEHVKDASVSQILREIETVKSELKDKSKERSHGSSEHKGKQTKEDKKQSKDIKELEKHVEQQLKDIQKENKNKFKEKIKDTKEQLKKYRDNKKDISKKIKEELKDKRDNNNNKPEKNNKGKPHIYKDKASYNNGNKYKNNNK